MVLDRLLLWIFGISSVVGTTMILSESPFLYDYSTPIDVQHSRVNQYFNKEFFNRSEFHKELFN